MLKKEMKEKTIGRVDPDLNQSEISLISFNNYLFAVGFTGSLMMLICQIRCARLFQCALDIMCLFNLWNNFGAKMFSNYNQ